MASDEHDGAAYLAKARALAPLLAASAGEIEERRRLPPALLDALFAAGLFRLLLSRSCGGAEVDLPRFAAIVEEIAKSEASAAWCLCQASGCSMVAAYLDPEVATAIFGRDKRAVLAWGPGPQSRARAVSGGYRVTGSWSFASGGRHASWRGGHCIVEEADGSPRRAADGQPVWRTMLFPAERAAMEDVWQVIGLKGTGSDSFAVTDLFVPHEYSVSRDDPAERREAGPLYRFSANSYFSAGFAGVALGIARSTLDAFLRLAGEKTPRGFRSRLAENVATQMELGQAEARLRAARSYLYATLDEAWAAVQQTEIAPLEQRMAIRLAATQAIQEAMAVVDFAYHAAGATAVFARNDFERRFRDMHTVAQQLQGRRSHFATVGQFLLGLAPDTAVL
jgi:alkylation response protein AidB-like acyl-CoA dehydrogenase